MKSVEALGLVGNYNAWYSGACYMGSAEYICHLMFERFGLESFHMRMDSYDPVDVFVEK